MPKLLLSAGAAALALSAALYALAGGGEVTTIPVMTRLPLPVCERTQPEDVQGFIVSNWDNTVCYFPAPSPQRLLVGGASGPEPLVTQETVEEMISALGGTAYLRKNGVLELTFPAEPSPTSQWRVTTRVDGRFYFPAQALIWADGPNSQFLSGYEKPVIRVGRRTFVLGDGLNPDIGPDFYNSIADKLIIAIKSEAITANSFTGARTHRIRTALKLGEVVMAVMHSHDNSYLTTFAPVDSRGLVDVKVNPAHLRFVSDFSQLKQVEPEGRTPTLLVRVTNVPLNNLKQGIFLPIQPTSDAN